MSESLRVLIIEDSEDDGLLLLRELKRGGYEVSHERVDTQDALESCLNKNTWDLVTSDYNMPYFNAPSALKTLVDSKQDVPFIVISGAIGEETAVSLMKAGAHDVVMKDNLSRLVPVVDRELREADRRAEQRQAELALKESQDQNQRLLDQYSVLAEIGRIISSSLDIDKVYGAFAESVRKLIPFDRVTIHTIDYASELIEVRYIAGEVVAGRESGAKFPIAGSVLETIINTRSGVIANNYIDGRALGRLPQSLDSGMTSALSVPLISDDEVIGALQFRAVDDNVYSDKHLDLAEHIASQIAGAIANAELYEESKRLEEQLLQSQKMEAVGKLAGGIAHDFNNLLTPIMGYTQLAIGSVGEENRAYSQLQEVYNAASKASDLVRQLLVFSRQEIIEPTDVDLGKLAINVENLMRRLLGDDIELVVKVPSDIGLVRSDPVQMEQVLVNLVVNAQDAMPDGGRLLIEICDTYLDVDEIRKYRDLSPGKYISLIVQDTGTGISEEVKARIFEPFFTTKGVGKGSGLGLSTCYGIVTQNGGTIVVDSELENGTTFTILLPTVEVPLSTPETEFVESTKVMVGNERLLLVEDETMVREVASCVLRERGYTVIEAIDGEDGLRLAKLDDTSGIDLLLTDVIMPHMNGRDLAEEVVRLHPNVKVIYMSGYTDDVITERELSLPGEMFLQKPFNPEILARKVRAVLDGF